MRLILLLLLTTLLSGCGYNQIQQKDEAVKAGWSEVLNQYKRRADLIPNLVRSGYAARGRCCRRDRGARQSEPINVNADDAHRWPSTKRRGRASQALAVADGSENYPNCKADASFLT